MGVGTVVCPRQVTAPPREIAVEPARGCEVAQQHSEKRARAPPPECEDEKRRPDDVELLLDCERPCVTQEAQWPSRTERRDPVPRVPGDRGKRQTEPETAAHVRQHHVDEADAGN